MAWAAGLAIALLGPAVQAAAAPGGGVSADEVASVLRDKGYQAVVAKDGAGDPMIRSGAEGVSFEIFFYGCERGPRCASVEFSAAYHIDGGLKLTDVNAWNVKNRFGRTYLDGENDPHMEMDLDLAHGAAAETIGAGLDTWDMVLASFQHMVRCSGAQGATGCEA